MIKKIFIILFFLSNFINIAKSEIIEGYCLVERSDLEIAKLSLEDHYRFLGKEIKLLVSFDEKLIADISDDGELSIITGMYGGTLEFTQISQEDSKVLSYKNEIKVTGDNETDLIKYKYKNKLQIVNNKITSLKALVDQTGFSMNNWNFQIDCRDYPYTSEEKIAAKKQSVKFCPKGTPKALCDYNNRKNLLENITKKIGQGKYSLLIEEDFSTIILFEVLPPFLQTINKQNKQINIISYGGYDYFKKVYDQNDSLAKTFVQPAGFSKDGKMESYMREGSEVDFKWKFKLRGNDQIVISDTLEFITHVESYIASDSQFTISSLNNKSWYAAKYDLVKNNEDLLTIYQKNQSTYCSLLKEKLVIDSLNLELQYNHVDFINFNKRNNINC